MHYYLRSLVRYSREPDKFIKTGRNMLRGPRVDSYVVSWPKTGRTWLRILLGKAIALHNDQDTKDVLDTYALSRAARCDTTMFSHGGRFHLFDPTHFEQVRFAPQRFGRKKVIFLTRDIRDTLVSSFFQESKRTEVFKGDIGQFIQDPQLGARKIIAFYNLWYSNRERVRDFCPVTYESLHADPVAELARLLSFLGLERIQPDLVQAAVDFGDFGNMRKLETSGTFNDSMMRPGRDNDSESLKVRRGKVGGYIDYLDESAQDYIAQAVADMEIPGCDWYYAPQGRDDDTP